MDRKDVDRKNVDKKYVDKENIVLRGIKRTHCDGDHSKLYVTYICFAFLLSY